MTTEIEELQIALTAATAEQQGFRDRVRREVLRQHFDGSWCLPGSQDVLNDLGLPPITMAFSGNGNVRIRINRMDGASNADEARARITQALDVTCSDADIEVELDYVDNVYIDERDVDDR